MAPRKPRKPAAPRVEFPKGRKASDNPNLKVIPAAKAPWEGHRHRSSTPPPTPSLDESAAEARKRLDQARRRVKQWKARK